MSVNWLVTVDVEIHYCSSEEQALQVARDESLENTNAVVTIWQRFGSVTTVKTATLTLPNDRKKELTKGS